jgi:hypothetical protein
MLPWQNNEYFIEGGGFATRNVLIGYGYDPESYISNAGLKFVPYTSQTLIQAKLGGEIKLIEACDDSVPAIGELSGDALLVYNSVLQNVTNEINGFLSPIYPFPLMQTGTVAILKVSGITSDGNGTVTSLDTVNAGNYAAAPAFAQSPVYLRHDDEEVCRRFWPLWQQQCGTGLTLSVEYSNTPVLVGGGATVNASSVLSVTITNGGTKYNCGELVILVGGSSFVPPKIQEAMLILCCHDFWQRRLSPDEKNLFRNQCKMWRGDGDKEGLLQNVADGSADLDGTFKRSFSAGYAWNRTSCLQSDTK